MKHCRRIAPMPELKPFRGIVYALDREQLHRVLCPPYDVVGETERSRLLALSRYNFIRLILPENGTRYQQSAKLQSEWLAGEILKVRPRPAFYIYKQRFSHAGKEYTRTALLAAVKLSDYDEGKIFPHERTHKRAKADRLRLLKATEANYDCVLGLYSDASGRVRSLLKAQAEGGELLLSAEDAAGCHNELIEVTDLGEAARLQEAFAEVQVVIGDGHHRYETALEYRNECRRRSKAEADAPWEYVLMALIAVEDEGLVVLPTHRVVNYAQAFGEREAFLEGLRRYFHLERRTRAETLHWEAQPREGFLVAFGQPAEVWEAQPKSAAVLAEANPGASPEWRSLDVSLVQEVVLKRLLNLKEEELQVQVTYLKTRSKLERLLKAQPRSVGFIMGAPEVGKILKLAVRGEQLPQKSTYLEPKLTSGIIYRSLKPEYQ